MTTNAVNILRRRYGTPASLQEARVHAEVGKLIYDMRTGADLTQAELAERIGTTQSVVSRLEDADYDGHSLSTLCRIAAALGKRIHISCTNAEAKT